MRLFGGIGEDVGKGLMGVGEREREREGKMGREERYQLECLKVLKKISLNIEQLNKLRKIN